MDSEGPGLQAFLASALRSSRLTDAIHESG